MTKAGWRRAVAVMLLLACLRLSAVNYYTDEVNSGNCRLSVKCTEPVMVNSLGFYCARASMLVDTVLCVKEIPKRRLRVLEVVEGGETGDKKRDESFQVLYSVGEAEVDFALDLFRQLVRRRLLPYGMPVDKPFLSAVTAGICHRYIRGRQSLSGYYEPDYEIARNQFMRKEFPKLDVLLSNPVPSNQRYFFELYMMHCDLLLLALESLQGTKGGIIIGMLAAEQGGEDAMAALERLVAPQNKSGESLQAMYERMVFKAARRRRRQNGDEVIEERVRELETVPVIGYESGTALRRVPLEDVPDVLKDYHSDVQAILRLEAKFRELREASPYLLREPLEKYALSMRWIREGNMRRFKKDIGEARREFQNALTRQRRLNKKVDKYEREHVPVLKRFVDYVIVSRFYRELSKKIYPTDPFVGK